MPNYGYKSVTIESEVHRVLLFLSDKKGKAMGEIVKESLIRTFGSKIFKMASESETPERHSCFKNMPVIEL